MKESKFEKWQEISHQSLLDAQKCPCANGDIEHCFLSLPHEAQIDLFDNDSILSFKKFQYQQQP